MDNCHKLLTFRNRRVHQCCMPRRVNRIHYPHSLHKCHRPLMTCVIQLSLSLKLHNRVKFPIRKQKVIRTYTGMFKCDELEYFYWIQSQLLPSERIKTTHTLFLLVKGKLLTAVWVKYLASLILSDQT